MLTGAQHPNPSPSRPPFLSKQEVITALPGGRPSSHSWWQQGTCRDLEGVPCTPAYLSRPTLPLSWHECNISFLAVVWGDSSQGPARGGEAEEDADGEGQASSQVGTVGTARSWKLESKAVCNPEHQAVSAKEQAPSPRPSSRVLPLFCRILRPLPSLPFPLCAWDAPPPPGYYTWQKHGYCKCVN